ncbi:MAG TPA: hypothetical protein VNW71_08835 [Thermoanaerobaculia bacterium]|nr:hypothetical protein [Thermoanaerobaculia bacterium]
MIVENLDQAGPEELKAAVFNYLAFSTADFRTYERLKDRRVIPVLIEILDAGGAPPFASGDLPPERVELVMTGAAHLLGDVATAEDKDAVRSLLGALDHENDRVKIAAAKALGQMRAAEAAGKVAALTRRMLEQGELGGISKLVPVLGQIGGEEARSLLESFVEGNQDSQDKHVQYVVGIANEALAAIRARQAG